MTGGALHPEVARQASRAYSGSARLARRTRPPQQQTLPWLNKVTRVGLGRSDRMKKSGCDEPARLNVFTDEDRDVIHRRAGIEDRADARFLQEIEILLWNDSADQKQYVLHLVLAKKIRDARNNGVVGAGKDRKTNHVNVFLQRRADNHFRG